jgi:hypothetical protein
LNNDRTNGDINPMAHMSQTPQAKEPINVSETAAALTLTGALVLGTLAVAAGDYVRGYFKNMRSDPQVATLDMSNLALPRVDK